MRDVLKHLAAATSLPLIFALGCSHVEVRSPSSSSAQTPQTPQTPQTKVQLDYQRIPSFAELEQIKYKPVPSNATQNKVEKRGFITVPLDYSRPDGPQIKVFYRLIPAYHSTPEDTSKPIIVVMNGGPGIPTKVYRPMDFNYDDPSDKKNGKFDRFKFLLNDFRILLVDQRGTDGYSAPLAMDAPNLRPEFVIKYFSTDSQAKDYLKAIETLIPQNEKFFIIAQSYGGMIGMKYLTLKSMRKPEGIVFSSSALPFSDSKKFGSYRRKAQLELNRQFLAAYPGADKRLISLREHFQSQGVDPNLVNYLWDYLGHGDAGIWERELSEKLDELAKLNTKEEIVKAMADDVGLVSLLNFILSASTNTPGYTDRTMAKMLMKEIPYESWMLDENWADQQVGLDGSWRQALVQALDDNPPPPVAYPSLHRVRKIIAQNHVLFTLAQGDAMDPTELQMTEIRKFIIKGHTILKSDIPGGHNAIFTESGYHALRDWIKTIQ